jgi:quercetin 2,3-dioxygenase
MEQIYLSEQRGQTQSEGFRSFHTFNFGAYQHESRQSFGSLYVLNDDTLAGGQRLKMAVEEDSHIILLPIVGAIAYKNSLNTDGTSRNNREEGYLSAGQAQIFAAGKGMSFEIENPYDMALVNVLQIWTKRSAQNFVPSIENFGFDLSEQKNSLISFYTDGTSRDNREGGTSCHIGQFDGRKEGVFSLKNAQNGVFTFVIEGVFEVQNRLLEARDGLSLSNIKEVEFEALSNNAIILFLEVNHEFRK